MIDRTIRRIVGASGLCPSTMRVMPALLGLLVVIGCQPRHYADPVSVMMDSEAQPVVRHSAAEQAARERPDDPARIAALKRLVVESGHPEDMRTYAVDELVAHDPAEAKRYLRTRIGRLNNWAVIQHILDAAVARGWGDFTPAIVRSYSREAWAYEDGERPERAALTALHPATPIRQIALSVFADEAGASVTERASAWVLLCRLVSSRSELAALLERAEARGPLAADLAAGLNELGVMARHGETIAWLGVLRTEPYRPLWRHAASAVEGLSAEQRAGLELRHVPLLAHLQSRGDERLGMSRAAMMARVKGRLADAEHHLKSADYDGHNDDHPQRLHDWRDELSFGDLLVIDALLEAMGDRRNVAAWFEQAEADEADESTEYGGLLRWNRSGEVHVEPYTPMLRAHDLKFIPPAAMTTDAYAALAHYHFHAQRHRNARYAGPGRGDLERIGDEQRLNGLVLTFIDKDRLNADFFRHGRVVVDLGTLRR